MCVVFTVASFPDESDACEFLSCNRHFVRIEKIKTESENVEATEVEASRIEGGRGT